MINEILNSLKTDLAVDSENPPVEMFFRDISQYKYISQNPVAVINFRGVDFEKPLHASISEQKGILDVSFFYFLRTFETAKTEGVLDFLENIRGLNGVEVLSCKVFSHRKNASIWEIKTRIVKAF